MNARPSRASLALVPLALVSLGVALLSAASLALPGVARAHLGSTKYLFVARTPEGAEVRADVDVIDVAYELDLGERATPAAVRAEAGRAARWLERTVHLRAEAGACHGRAETPTLRDRDGRPYLSTLLRFTCPDGAARLVLRDDAVFDDDPQHEAVVRLSTDGGATATVLRARSRELRVEPAERPIADVIATFVYEGALHLVTGYDHLLFLLSLLLVAGEHAARDGTKKALRDVALVVTGFTLGHSLTLIAAALDLVVLPSRLVETAIAASIVAVALWNLWRPEHRRGLPAVATAFGLIHGFGFSSVLRELVLPRAGRVTALLAFNLGIELAQLAAVALALAPLALAARSPRFYRPVILRGGSALIALIATYWMIERGLGG
jgi:hypothetical protein